MYVQLTLLRLKRIPFLLFFLVYTLAYELYPGKFRPTLTHSFIRLLSQKNLLDTCFTQNIDTLERRAGVPEGKIIEAHGSFASQRCVNCSGAFDGKKMREYIKKKEVPKCENCKGFVKPDIVFFGEGVCVLSTAFDLITSSSPPTAPEKLHPVYSQPPTGRSTHRHRHVINCAPFCLPRRHGGLVLSAGFDQSRESGRFWITSR